jgi:hypothetical protein
VSVWAAPGTLRSPGLLSFGGHRPVSRLFTLVPAVVLAISAAGCHEGQVRLPLSRGGHRFEWQDRLDAEQFRSPVTDLLFVVEAPVGYPAARLQPLEGFLSDAKLRWNDAVAPLYGHFELLRRQHDEARVNIQEFNQRHQELLSVVQLLQQDRADLMKALAACLAAAQSSATEAPGPSDGGGPAAAEMAAARAAAEAVIQRAGQRVSSLGAAEPPAGGAAGPGPPAA